MMRQSIGASNYQYPNLYRRNNRLGGANAADQIPEESREYGPRNPTGNINGGTIDTQTQNNSEMPLYLSTLPMVNSPGGSTMYMSTTGDDPFPQEPGIFSLVNQVSQI